MNRLWVTLGFSGLMVVSASAGDEHALFKFVNKTLQAYVAKTQCVGFDVVYEDLTQRAAELDTGYCRADATGYRLFLQWRKAGSV
jgi:hypothetical protein